VLAYGALAIYLLVARRLLTAKARARHGVVAALASNAVWAGAQLAAAHWPLPRVGGLAPVLGALWLRHGLDGSHAQIAR
jgi:hypothetical protein